MSRCAGRPVHAPRAGVLVAGLAWATAPGAVEAQPWTFDEPPIEVIGASAGVFHQMSSAGRRSLAVSDGTVAVVWDDEHAGTPHAYLALKDPNSPVFASAIQISGDGEAFEPGIAALPDGRFAVAWEEDGRILVRRATPDGLGPPLELSPGGAQVTLDGSDGDLVAVWADRQTGVGRIMTATLGRDGPLGLAVKARCPADAATPVADQLFPTAAQVGDRLVVAWEDRRPGHTIIMAAASAPGRPCRFDPPVRISEDPPGPQMPYGAGHGVARVAIAPYGADRLLAAWEDKRNFRHGYDVYAGHFGPDGFGRNERVQDDFGELSAQWHVSAAGHPDGTLVVAWTDEREGQGDILLSWYADGTWSDDFPLPGASGPEEQGHPSIALDDAGNLHAAWVTRETKGGPTHIQYRLGRRAD
ncbi:hypothetical protein [Thiocapsa bogorovii]|uniref:hypothetical protein n=1 Tax=Thiocapsa bogorovii TaxID=521689 RepID=UPI001E48DA94|nr:hypothetical protein [Thiocapsa bogorovii]UHD15280.1 hypothetical protein LT988_18695 [Thiocapsa bogorovii]